MRRFSEDNKLDENVILSIMTEEKPNQREKFTIPAERLRGKSRRDCQSAPHRISS